MPVRATKRGAERTPLEGLWDVVICGASFAGLAAARELAGSGADVLVVDRYEIGERQTSACAVPTAWISGLDLDASIRQTFSQLVVNVPGRSYRWELPEPFSTFDYRELCLGLAAQGRFRFETAKVEALTAGAIHTVHTDRGDLRAPLVVDALGWRRVLGTVDGSAVRPPEALMSRGLEVHPAGRREDLSLWLDRRYARAGYAWSFPAGDEVRVGVGSFEPRDHVKDPTLRLAGDVGLDAEGFQGNWIPHQMRLATENGVFFAGDSAGHCLPTTAEGIRTALYFGLACGREMRAVLDGTRTRADALGRYSALCEQTAWKFRVLLALQGIVGHVVPRERLLRAVIGLLSRPAIARWMLVKYLHVAPAPSSRAAAAPRDGQVTSVAA